MRRILLAFLILGLFLGACAEESSDPTASGTQDNGGSEPAENTCDPEDPPLFADGVLTVATDRPAYPPWFEGSPKNYSGYEGEVANEIADRMGLDITWVVEPFNKSYAPGAKSYDFDINQISITAKRAESVTFSRGYYSAAQAVIATGDSEYASATSLAELADAKFGAQVGTTSLTAVTDVIQPTEEPAVFDDTTAATNSLENDQVDAIVADLPTAFYLTAAVLNDGVIVGQFQPETGETEEFGLLFEQDNPLVDCVNQALDALDEDGTLAALEERWLSDVAQAPELS